MLIKPNMAVAGKACSRQPEEVAIATLRCLRNSRHD
jgi:fructose-bisphosphate aldolase class 1